jgi:Lipocalin-like domain
LIDFFLVERAPCTVANQTKVCFPEELQNWGIRRRMFVASITTQTSLVGTWELLSREDMTSDGERQVEPNLGSDPLAYLIYDATGHFAVQFMRRVRNATGSTNNTGTSSGYDAYFGRYSVADGTVTQELVGALSPGDVGKVVTRQFQINDNELVITLETTSSDGTPVTRTLRWKRLA